MKDKILINGEWYIKLEPTVIEEEEIELDVTESKSRIYEAPNHTYEAYLVWNENIKEYYPGVSITVTDKRTNEKDEWDNPLWMGDVVKGVEKCYNEFKEKADKVYFIRVLKDLQKVEWLK
jgi:hypothetical protein